MSAPGVPPSLFGGDDKPMYPPAPQGFRYVDTNIPQAPPGYSVAKMSDIVRSGGQPGTASSASSSRQHYVHNAHTPEGIKERADEYSRLQRAHQELLQLQNPNYKPRGGRFDSNTASGQTPNSPNLPAVLQLLQTAGQGQGINDATNFNVPPNEIPIPPPGTLSKLLARQNANNKLGADVQKKLESISRGANPIVPSPRPDISDWQNQGPLPGMPQSTAPPVDATQSRLDAKSTSPTTSRSMMPAVLQDLWQRFSAPVGPAFDPSKVNLDEMKYDPLPEVQ